VTAKRDYRLVEAVAAVRDGLARALAATVPPAMVSVATPDCTDPLSAQLNETTTSLCSSRKRSAGFGCR